MARKPQKVHSLAPEAGGEETGSAGACEIPVPAGHVVLEHDDCTGISAGGCNYPRLENGLFHIPAHLAGEFVESHGFRLRQDA